MPEYGEDDVTLDGPGTPVGASGAAADRRIELPINLPRVRRRRARGVVWFIVGFLGAVTVVLGLVLMVR